MIFEFLQYLDAFEKLLKLDLEGQREREILHVIVECSMNEKSPNPYYAHLIKRFCEFHRRFQLTAQFAIWDKLKNLKNSSNFWPKKGENLANLIEILIRTRTLPLSVLKVIEFGNLDSGTEKLLKILMKNLLTKMESVDVEEIFQKLAGKEKISHFVDELRLFLHQNFQENSKNSDEKSEKNQDSQKMKQTIEMVDKILLSNRGNF